VRLAFDLHRIILLDGCIEPRKGGWSALEERAEHVPAGGNISAHGIEQGFGVDVLVSVVVHAFLPVADAIYARYCSCANLF
jgi:hypothetical protein